MASMTCINADGARVFETKWEAHRLSPEEVATVVHGSCRDMAWRERKAASKESRLLYDVCSPVALALAHLPVGLVDRHLNLKEAK